MVSKKVFACWGWTVLMLLKARPTRPLEAVSWTKEPETVSASSMVCWGETAPPMLTTSVPMVSGEDPAAVEPSPNWMEKLCWSAPAGVKVADLAGSKTWWPCCCASARWVLKSQLYCVKRFEG